MLHELGAERLANDAGDALVTRENDGSLEIALWNPVEPGQTTPPIHFRLKITGLKDAATVTIARADAKHGDSYDVWKSIGSPRFPTREQIAQLKAAAAAGEDESTSLKNGILEIDVPESGLAVVHIAK